MISNAPIQDSKSQVYDFLFSKSSQTPNAHYLASIISSYIDGESALPARLGLSEEALTSLFNEFFPHAIEMLGQLGGEDFDETRLEEYNELLSLFLTHRKQESLFEEHIARIVTAACMGSDHLWQDLGLWSRPDLSQLMSANFTALADKNTKNMKWKRFLYKQLCEAEGIYVCRSPSCEVCTEYSVCFAPEE